ncbi:MAG: hypothetical protein Q7N50_05630 [Armatimonadota bacterium]|nr:hypothetical protein [Armatimonadota bacterium]
MKYFKRIKSLRLLCYLLSILMAAPAFIAITPMPASAQLQELVQVAVVDFENRTGVQGDYLGKLASDALVLELNESRRFDVIPRSVMQTEMENLGFSGRLSRRQLLRLGERVVKGEFGQPSAIIEGEVTAIKIKGDPRRANITMVARMIDVASGEVINGAIATGVSQLRVGYTADDDQLITEALNDAAYQAVKTMVDYIIPEATVQNTIGINEVLLNKGARDGIKRGMKMVVFRVGEVVGRVEVKDVTPNDATASVIHATKGVKPEDRVRAIFDAPVAKGNSDNKRADISSGGGGSSGAGRTRSTKSKSKLLIGLLAIAGLAYMFRGGSGTESLSGVSARAGVPPELSDHPVGGVMVKDEGQLGGGSRQMSEYHIWRDDNNFTTPVGVSGTSSYVDKPIMSGPREVAYSVSDPLTLAKAAGQSPNMVPYPLPGQQYRYKMSALYWVTSPGSTTERFYETDKVDAGTATIIEKLVTADLAYSDGDRIVPTSSTHYFKFKSRKGADKFIIQISSASSFANPVYTSPEMPTTQLESGFDELFYHNNISSYLNPLRNPDKDVLLYWRVGVKNSTDSPGPLPAYGTRNMCWLFSAPATIYLPAGPPDPP